MIYSNCANVVNYSKTIKSVFSSLKSIQRFDELMDKSIRLPCGKGYLVCVSELCARDDKLISLLAKWRSDATTFHNKFNVTFASTERWLRKLLLDIPDRILFLVLNEHGNPIGHMGFANALNGDCVMEFDNVIRGVHGQDYGLMSVAVRSLLGWATETFKPQVFFIRTLDDNEHAIQFYLRLGFVMDGQQGLRRIEKNGEVNHLPIEVGDTNPPDRYFVRMRFNPECLSD